MTRDEMLKKLKTLRFTALWPQGWEDIEFTERPIWINSFGYGYYDCDEPCSFAVIDGVSDEDIKNLKSKINSETITVEELEKSPFNSINRFEHYDFWEYTIDDLLKLPDHTSGQIFCGEDIDGWGFYVTEEKLIDAFDKKDYFCEPWEEMDDELLEMWCERLSNEKDLDIELPLTLSIFK